MDSSKDNEWRYRNMEISKEWNDHDRMHVIEYICAAYMALRGVAIDPQHIPALSMQTVSFIASSPADKLEGLRNRIESLVNVEIPKLLNFVNSINSNPIDTMNVSQETNEYYQLTHSIFYPFLTWQLYQ